MITDDESFNREPSVDASWQPAEITLSNADRDCLLGLVDNPLAPTQNLCELMRRDR